MKLVLATGNPHKLEELTQIFARIGLHTPTLRTLTEAARGRPLAEPSEVGGTFEANAGIKAVEYAAQVGMPCLADDSGIEVDALDGRPGVISSHFCTDGREVGMTRAERDAANNARLLKELHAVPPDRRTARFVCVMAIAHPGDAAPRILVRGTFEGRIGLPADVPRGQNGFGYDPLFLVAPDFSRTAAELQAIEKNRLSHRAAAARALAAALTAGAAS